MFSNDGRTSGFMGGSTNIPPMPAPSQPSTSNGLQNLALASTSSYYTDYNPAQFNVEGTATAAPPATGNESPAGTGSGEDKSMGRFLSQYPCSYLNLKRFCLPLVIHRVRKNDRGRICTSCGTTNSPGKNLSPLEHTSYVHCAYVDLHCTEWRKGPSGIKTLCNACGLRYSRAQARKAKKAAKEAEAQIVAAGGTPASAANNNNNSSNGSGAENISTSYNIPTPLQIPTSATTATSGGPPSASTPHSPYLPIGDYAVHAPLPPLPQPTHEEQQPHSANSANGSGQNIPTGAGNGSYSNFVNYPYEQWGSPMYDQSFAAQQQQGQ